MIEAVLFDLDGTLVDFVGSDQVLLRSFLAKSSAKISPEEFIDASVEVIKNFRELLDSGQIDLHRLDAYRLQHTFEHFGLPWDEGLLSTYRQGLIDLCEPYAGVVPLLRDLKSKVKTGLITNAFDGVNQRQRIAHAGLTDFFDEIIIAGDTQFRKPDPAIFHLTLERLSVAPEKALFVGDSETYDVAGAKAAGLQAVLIRHTDRPESELADFCVLGIEELNGLLKALL